MADIGSRSIGELNVHKVILGYQRTFKTVHPGDLSAATVSASVGEIALGVVIGVYDSVTDTTTINYTLTAENSALLSLGRIGWQMILTENSIPVPYFAGYFEVETL